MDPYRTLTGRVFDLRSLSQKERDALAEVEELFRTKPDWTEFARAWPAVLRRRVLGRRRMPVGSPLYRVCQDMELRLGVAQGQVAPPRLSRSPRRPDRAEVRESIRVLPGRRDRPGQPQPRPRWPKGLLLGRPEEGPRAPRRAVGPRPDVRGLPKGRHARTHDPAERLRQLSYQVSTLENLKAKAAELSPKKRASVVPETPGLFPDGLEGLRTRLRDGQAFDEALSLELTEALGEQARLARQIAKSAERRRELVSG